MPLGSSRRSAILAQLKEVGLATNESKAYLTLLEGDGATGLTGYEVASRSSIPRSAVYGALDSLCQLGAAFCSGSSPKRYLATEPVEWVDRMRKESLSSLTRLEESLRSLPHLSRPQPIWILSRYEDVLSRAEELIRQAQRSVFISVWPRELEFLRAALSEATESGMRRILHSPVPLEAPLEGFSCWAEDPEIMRAEEREDWSHRILIVADDREALIGGAEPEQDNQVVWTRNRSLVELTLHHMVLDITLMAKRQGRDCQESVGWMMRPQLDTA